MNHRVYPLLLLPLATLLTGREVRAQATASPTRAAGTAAAPILRASSLTGAIRIDGRFDEAAWSTAEIGSEFTESYPNVGAPSRLRTEARVLYDEEALYVAMRMFDPNPDSIAAQLARRDATGIYSDWAQVMIDSYGDRRTGFAFGVNPRGVKRDVLLFNDTNEDLGWDAVWEVAAQVDSLGWTAEFRIPFSQLRFSRSEPAGGRTWGLQLTRDIARYEARASWSPWSRNDNGFVSRFGRLIGLQGVRAPRQLELQPYTVARLTRAPGDAANPFYEANDASASVGADLRYGLPWGLTLSATINPDFGQVEVDPAFVNLSAFEIQLPERRPFFVEGTDIFRFGSLISYISQGSPQFFYSRRIGRTPQRNLAFDPTLQFYDAPSTSTILGAAKVSGKTANGWSAGILDAVTSREQARVLQQSGESAFTPVEPLSNYFVGRVRRDLNAGRTVVGGIATATHRSMEDSVFAPMLRSDAYVAGVDAEHSWGRNRQWAISGFMAGSRVDGSTDAIGAAQRSSARYFRRPDADYLLYDSTRTGLAGYSAGAALRKGGAWRGSVWYQEVSPGFETNDLGFQGRADTRALSALYGYRHDKSGPVFRDWFVRAFTSHRWNFGGDRILESYALRGNGTFRNLWSGSATVEYSPSTFNDRLTRGGPLTRSPAGWALSGSVGSDPRKRVSASGDAYAGSDDSGGYARFVGVGLQARPTETIQINLGPELEQTRSTAQYVRVRTDDLATETFGRRYVFATLDQTTVAVSTRVNWTFSPTLSLQFYARPFISAGDYRDFKELAAPRSFDFARYGTDRGTIALDEPCGSSAGSERVYTIDPDGVGSATCFQFNNPNFNFRNLRGNAVLRWEYRPGSTLFLVWQQERSGETALGNFDVRRDTSDLFRTPARNVFLIKATYWLSR